MPDQIWTEKYRPRKLEEVVGQDDIVERLRSYVRTKSLPHLLFSGPAGVGKTACAVSLAREMFGEDWHGNFTELNASDERGIETVRVSIKNFARTAPVGAATFKIIFLDEADMLTVDAQSALRRTMERFSSTCRFIFSVNYSSKVIEPIQSRCTVYRFRPLSNDAVYRRLRFIVGREKVELADDGLKAITDIAQGDMRLAINALQSAAVLGKKIDAGVVYQTTAAPKPEEIRALIEASMKGDFLGARTRLSELIESGLSGGDILQQIHKAIFSLELPDLAKVEMLEKIGETDFRLTEGANEKIQLEALIALFSIKGAKGGYQRQS